MSYFGSLDRRRIGDIAADALLLIPVGATEQHGPALPTLTDTIHVSEVARLASSKIRADIPVLIAPALPYGCSAHHLPFGATLSLQAETLLRVLKDLAASAVQSGFGRIFFLNGHGGNHEVVHLVAREAALEHGCHAGGGSWWEMARQHLQEDGLADLGPVPGHAGAFEAAIIAALHPEMIDRSFKADGGPGRTWAQRPISYRGEHPATWIAADGYSDDPSEGDEEIGRRILEVAASAVAACLAEFYEACR